jgi:septal ring-binding cell division protein DamX
MDLAVYICELLGMQGEVNVPGIGYFAQVRVNGYYDQVENKFYPPAHDISFEPHSRDDDQLAHYIANKKNISMASAKYFIDKYVAGLKQQLTLKKVEIAGVGTIYNNGSVIEFKADNASKTNDPSFYGFPPVNLDQPEEKPEIKYTPPVKEEEPVKEEIKEEVFAWHETPAENIKPAEDIPAKPVEETIIRPEPAEEAQVEEEQEYTYDEPVETGNRNNVWIALLLIVIIALLALLGLYKYKPKWFEHSSSKDSTQTFVAASPDTVKKATDTTSKTASKPDSAGTVATPTSNAPADTAAVLHYEILGGAFKTLVQADGVIKKYQSLGLHPRLLKHAAGNFYKITLGTYFTKDEAQKVEDSILNSTRINKNNIYLQPYLPKK